nr:MAG TPA: hypothetical protein [Caudoviricetes sp.]DAS81308.1 MAG TPA: hypothetical protein [Caudoviricetes sp.]
MRSLLRYYCLRLYLNTDLRVRKRLATKDYSTTSKPRHPRATYIIPFIIWVSKKWNYKKFLLKTIFEFFIIFFRVSIY